MRASSRATRWSSIPAPLSTQRRNFAGISVRARIGKEDVCHAAPRGTCISEARLAEVDWELNIVPQGREAVRLVTILRGSWPGRSEDEPPELSRPHAWPLSPLGGPLERRL